MEIKSDFLGVQNIDPDTIITFPKGIPGFENNTQYKLFHQEGENPLIFWLQSVEDATLVFSVAQPSMFNINYNFMLSDEEEALLELEKDSDIVVMIILHKDASEQPMIKGSIRFPLVINATKRIGLQKVLNKIEQSITLTDVSNVIHVTEG